jgi:protein-tyrosine phosphatase
VIDTHCHILPGLDDGPGSLDEALQMARVAAADGVRRVVATPHQEGWDVTASERVQAEVGHFQRELSLCGIALEVMGGAELMMSHELLNQTGAERMHTIGGSRYLLVELPAFDYPLYTAEVIFALQLRGLTPIVAHPERNAVIQDDLNRMARLVQRGVLGQLTADSLLPDADRGVRRTADQLVRRGLVHLMASDAHDADRRGPCLSEGVRAAACIVGQEQAEALVTRVPAAVLADQEVDADMFRPEPVHWWSGLRLRRRDPAVVPHALRGDE